MDLISDRGRRVPIEELNTSRLLAARPQAGAPAQIRRDDDRRCRRPSLRERALRRIPAVHGKRRAAPAGRCPAAAKSGSRGIVPIPTGYQDMGGRVTRYPMRGSEKTEDGKIRDVQLGHRWMDAMGVDYSCLFPTGMLNIGLHPQTEMEVDLCWAYNRWLTEKVMPEAGGRFFSLLMPAVSRSRRGVAPRRDLRRAQERRRLHGDDRAHQHGRARQRLHEGLSGDGGARPRASPSIPA